MTIKSFPTSLMYPNEIPPRYLPPPPPPPPPSPSSEASFPILAISILGILTTAILLLSYYIFVIKCCLNWHRSDVIRRLSRSRRRSLDDSLTVYSSAAENRRGLEESAIREIPTFRFRKVSSSSSFHECAVCLNEFQEEERIRLLPNCFHVFHIDCIDTWLQTNAKCPLCRSEITTTIISIPTDHFMAQNIHQNLNQSDQDIVIEVRDDGNNSMGKGRKLQHNCSMGDEYIDVRGVGDERFSVQPMRRSFSMDSSNDRQLQLAVQEILRQNSQSKEVDIGEGCSSSSGGGGGVGRVRRTFFSFGHGRSSRSSVAPIQFEL